MAANIADIVTSVRTILDHNVSKSVLEDLEDIITLDIDTIIRDAVKAGAMQLMQMVPVELADITVHSYDASSGNVLASPFVMALPTDFLRFVSCQMGGWSYPVTELTAQGSKEHLRQYGEFDDLKATNNRPVAVMGVAGDPETAALVMYGGNKHTSASCCYIGMPEITQTTIAIGDRLYTPLCYIIAALVCEVLKDTAKSQYLIQTARSLMTSAERVEEQLIRTNT